MSSPSRMLTSKKGLYTIAAIAILLSFVYLISSRLNVKDNPLRDDTDASHPRNNSDTSPSPVNSIQPINQPQKPPQPPRQQSAPISATAGCTPINYLQTKPNFESPITDEFMDLGGDECYHASLDPNADEMLMELRCESTMNFWLIWSTSRKDWKLKHYRVIDSIYYYHPNATVHVLTKDMTSNDFSFYASRFKFILHQLDADKIFKHTPLERWIDTSMKDSKIKNHKNFFSHLTDAMRIALLWKYGGVYLDTDAFLLKPVDKIRNTIGYQGGGGGDLNGAVLMFDRQHPFLYYAMHTLIRTYNVNVWGIAGPELMTRCVIGWGQLDPMMVRWIPTPFIIGGDVTLPNEPLGTASISVFTDQYQFYPISWFQPRVDLNPKDPGLPQLRENVEKRSYVYHYFNQVIKNRKIAPDTFLYEMMHKGCLYACNNTNVETAIDDIRL